MTTATKEALRREDKVVDGKKEQHFFNAKGDRVEEKKYDGLGNLSIYTKYDPQTFLKIYEEKYHLGTNQLASKTEYGDDLVVVYEEHHKQGARDSYIQQWYNPETRRPLLVKSYEKGKISLEVKYAEQPYPEGGNHEISRKKFDSRGELLNHEWEDENGVHHEHDHSKPGIRVEKTFGEFGHKALVVERSKHDYKKELSRTTYGQFGRIDHVVERKEAYSNAVTREEIYDHSSGQVTEVLYRQGGVKMTERTSDINGKNLVAERQFDTQARLVSERELSFQEKDASFKEYNPATGQLVKSIQYDTDAEGVLITKSLTNIPGTTLYLSVENADGKMNKQVQRLVHFGRKDGAVPQFKKASVVRQVQYGSALNNIAKSFDNQNFPGQSLDRVNVSGASNVTVVGADELGKKGVNAGKEVAPGIGHTIQKTA